MGRTLSNEKKQLIEELDRQGLPVTEISRRAHVDYHTAYFRTRLKRRINPETGQPFGSLKEYVGYLSRRRQQPINQVPNKELIEKEQKYIEVPLDIEPPLIAALWSLEAIRPPTKIGYNDFAALFAVAQNYSWSGQVFPRDISQALNANFFTPDDGRLQPQGLEPYFEKLEQLGLIQGTSQTGYTMDSRLVRIVFDNFDRYVTPSLTKERFWGSIQVWYRLD